ncbi:protein AF-17-like [Centropristis striata]|uniref:protein AF-17-like n=1 Tax=Centropristis striata TaxID=184440 RepID=UPI0027E18256|nr:protein AF-17-like [Centropristis striata]XP_059180082.1 protein AF-17-like [Centropristis striata]
MVYGLSLSISWICLLISSGSCFPTAKGDYKYPYTAPRGFSGDAAPRTSPLNPGSRAALLDLQYGQSAGYQQPSQQPGAPTGNQSPSGVGGPSVVLGTSPSYEPNRFLVSSGSSSNKPFSGPEVPSQGAGYVSPPRPANTGSFSVKPQAAGGAASDPVYAAPAYSNSRYMAPTLDFGDGPVPYIGDPTAFNYGYGSSNANANTGPATYYTADTSSYGSYYAAPETSSYGSDSAPGLPWVEQPIETSFSDPSNWLPRGDFPDFSVWGSNANSKMSKTAESEEETSPIPSSTYIIQSRNGYLRGLEYRSHTNYAPEDPEPLVFVAEPVTAPRPAAPSKGGKKI